MLLTILKKYEKFMIQALMVMMAIVLGLATLDLGSLPDTFSVDKSLKARHARLKLHCKEISMSDNKNGFARLLAL